MKQLREVCIAAHGRSAVCRAKKGLFANIHPVEYASQVLNGVLDRVPALQREEIDDVIVGCANHTNECAKNMARLIVLRAGLPTAVCAHTINRFCSSGLQAIATGANAIAAGQQEVVIAGGVEAMTQTFGQPYDKQDTWLAEHCEGAYMSMGETAERVAERYHISRDEMEALALASHQKAAAARLAGKLAPSIIPVSVITPEGETKTVTEDEGILANADGTLKTSMEKMAAMRPCFRENGVVTAATSSQTSDAAAFVVLMDLEKAKSLGIQPLARLTGYAVAGCDPDVMGLGPIYAVPKVMKQTGLTMEQMDVIELNEAFAAQAIPCMNILHMPRQKVNPYGGAMALGHPMGATGAILTGKALDYLKDNALRYALVTMCIGGGMGAAAIFESLL